MRDFIDDHGLLREYHEHILEEIGNDPIWLGYIACLDAGSDVEDPEDPTVVAAAVATDAAAAAAEQQALIEAVGSLAARRRLEQEVQRLRTQLADCSGALKRARLG